MKSLPEFCYGTLPSTGEIIVIERGESGYYKHKPLTGQEHMTVDELNALVEVTKGQRKAMETGSMFGWECAGANILNYDDDGNYLGLYNSEGTMNDVVLKDHYIIKQQDIDNLCCTAFEGGITHWCDSVEPVDGYYPKGARYASDVLSRSGELKATLTEPIDDEDEEYILNLQKLIKGIEMFLDLREQQGSPVDDISSVDAEDADSIIQFALFGELIFG